MSAVPSCLWPCPLPTPPAPAPTLPPPQKSRTPRFTHGFAVFLSLFICSAGPQAVVTSMDAVQPGARAGGLRGGVAGGGGADGGGDDARLLLDEEQLPGGGYAAAYAKLANASGPERPVLADIPDPQQYAATSIASFMQRAGRTA